jgi:hypothetical protein
MKPKREPMPEETRALMRLERRSIEANWAVPEPKKRAIIDRLCRVLDRRTREGKNAKARQILIAARTLMSADLRQQELDLIDEIALGGGPSGTLTDVVESVAERVLAYDAERERERSESA